MNLGWKFLLPVALSSIVVTGLLWVTTDGNRLIIGIGNVVVAFIVVAVVGGLLVMNKVPEASGPKIAGLDELESEVS